VFHKVQLIHLESWDHLYRCHVNPILKIMIKLKEYDTNPALIVIDMQNGFVSKGGSYDLLGMNVLPYQQVIPKIRI
jgi:hypothetical protein